MSSLSVPGGGGNWELLETITIADDAEQTQDFAAVLDGDVDKRYRMEFFLINDNAATATYSLHVNLATWAVNRQFLNVGGATISAARDTATDIVSTVTGEDSQVDVDIYKAETGSTRHAWVRNMRATGVLVQMLMYHFDITTPSTAVNITRLGLTNDRSDGIGIGSVLRLWRAI